LSGNWKQKAKKEQAFGKVAGTSLIVRTGPQSSPAPGSLAQLGFTPDAAHWFHPVTQQRIDA